MNGLLEGVILLQPQAPQRASAASDPCRWHAYDRLRNDGADEGESEADGEHRSDRNRCLPVDPHCMAESE
jgi:hypothetical protein